MLKRAAEEIQMLINEVMSDELLCFQCRSAAVGLLITNLHINQFYPEVILLDQSDKIPWNTFYGKVSSFENLRWAACKPRVKPHVDLKKKVSYCFEEVEKMSLGLDYHQLIKTQLRDAITSRISRGLYELVVLDEV